MHLIFQIWKLERAIKFWLVGWLAEKWMKRWPAVSKVEMLDLPWFDVEEGIQRLTEVGKLEWICHLRPTHSH